MFVCLCLDPSQTRVWHIELLERLASRSGMRAGVRFAPGVARNGFAEPLLRLEGALRRHGGGRLSRSVPALALGSPLAIAEEPDITIDLSGRMAGPKNLLGSSPVVHAEEPPQATSPQGEEGRSFQTVSKRCWTLMADGCSGEDALWEAVLLGRCPMVELRQGSRVIAAGRLGTEAKGQLIESLDDALARTITLIAAALDGRTPAPPAPFSAPPPPHLTATRAVRTAATVAARRLTSRLHRLAFRTPHWRVGWRALDGLDLIDLGHHPDGGWQDLPDDGLRFYADPFPIQRDGRVTLFVEEFPHATRRGIIAAVPFGPGGPIGRPEPVLERPYHLSYPFVFERDGEVWMIPESAEAGTIDLFRATRFPGGWVREATLVSGIEAGDATLVEWNGLWWMFATVRDGGAASDALHLWSAPDFRGPWQAHPSNPVLIDIAGARPAGRMSVRDGALIRPVQDCRDGYGAALGIATVTRLDPAGYDQRIETVLTPGPRWAGHCLHTVNEAGGFEFIDGSGRASRFGRAQSASARASAIGHVA